MSVSESSYLRQRGYITVSLTHFFVDVLNSGRNLLVAVLALSLGLTNAQVGITLLFYNVGNALTQPFFGLLADRIGPRLLVLGGMGWMTLFYALASVAGDWAALVALTVASLGSGAFHPTGTKVASQVTDNHRNRATAIFFMAGQLGLFLGPVVAGVALEAFGRPGYLVLPALSVVALISGWQWISRERRRPEALPPAGPPIRPAFRPPDFRRRAVLLTLLVLNSYTVGISIVTYTPKLLAETGYGEGYVGLLAGLFTLGSAVGGITGGVLADRIRGKWVVALGMLGAIVPVAFFVPAGNLLQALLLFLAGFFTGIPHTVLVLMVQSLFPGRRAMASGLALGFMFSSGAVGSYAVGVLADQIGLGNALQLVAAPALIAGVLALLLPAGNIGE